MMEFWAESKVIDKFIAFRSPINENLVSNALLPIRSVTELPVIESRNISFGVKIENHLTNNIAGMLRLKLRLMVNPFKLMFE